MAAYQTTPRDIIEHLLPNGSRGNQGDVELYPRWPPDMFGVVAYLAQLSDCYTTLVPPQQALGDSVDSLVLVGRLWASELGLVRDTEQFLQALWNTLLNSRQTVDGIASIPQGEISSSWVGATLQLLVIADEASAGIGFGDFKNPERQTWVQRLLIVWEARRSNRADLMQQQDKDWHKKYVERAMQGPASPQGGEFRLTANIMVPTELLQVLPKTRTPSVGCTLRSASHHLALLPPRGQVDVSWTPSPLSESPQRKPFNILVVPFPYEISGRDFSGTLVDGVQPVGYFSLGKDYITSPRVPGQSGSISLIELLTQLLQAARQQVERVDMLLLPELALNDDLYSQVADRLAGTDGLQMFVSGVHSRNEAGQAQNVARTTFYPQEQVYLQMRQKKHHRWCLEQNQIATYSLGDSLNPNYLWWEDIDVNDRRMDFVVFSDGSCFTTLICEDLARVDPCQSAIRAIGPNLVFALLMDGPQIDGRWPGRYAMALADDPGSSVLSVTSLGLLQRSNIHFDKSSRSIALWRDPESGTQCINLPQGHHGVVLNLNSSNTQEYTLDGRSKGDNAVFWKLTGKIPIKL